LNRRLAIALPPLVALCASCTLTPPRAQEPATLAFPPVTEAVRARPSLPPLLIFPIDAPSWLETRLLYVRRTGSLTIRAHRRAVWIASLPGLLSGSLRAFLIPHERPGAPALALHVRLFDLEETLAHGRARVVFVARTRLASLLPSVPERVRLWRLTTAASAGARAEARAIVELDRRFNACVLRWLARATAASGAKGLRGKRPSR
jgi:hypothetical protein